MPNEKALLRRFFQKLQKQKMRQIGTTVSKCLILSQIFPIKLYTCLGFFHIVSSRRFNSTGSEAMQHHSGNNGHDSNPGN